MNLKNDSFFCDFPFFTMLNDLFRIRTQTFISLIFSFSLLHLGDRRGSQMTVSPSRFSFSSKCFSNLSNACGARVEIITQDFLQPHFTQLCVCVRVCESFIYGVPWETSLHSSLSCFRMHFWCEISRCVGPVHGGLSAS